MPNPYNPNPYNDIHPLLSLYDIRAPGIRKGIFHLIKDFHAASVQSVLKAGESLLCVPR